MQGNSIITRSAVNKQEHRHEISKTWIESLQPRNGTRLPMTCFRRSGQQIRATWTSTIPKSYTTAYVVSSQRSTSIGIGFVDGLLVNSSDLEQRLRMEITPLEENLAQRSFTASLLRAELGKNTESGSTLTISVDVSDIVGSAQSETENPGAKLHAMACNR